MAENERRLAAIMFADVVGYTALTRKDEPFALQVVSRIRQVISPVVGRHGGRLVKTMGDGFLVEFSSAMDGVLCGIEVQHLMRLHSSEHHDGGAQVKIGIHVGDVIEENGDVLGDAVNIASRIEPLAGPGEICISAEVMRQVKSRLSYAMISLGLQKLKNVDEPVEVYRVLLPWANQPEGQSQVTKDRRRLVVLPLNSYSPDPNDEYFADGMTEEIISKLSGLTGLRVIARTSSMKYKGVRKSVSEIGTELGVGSVLEGSVRKSGERMRITLQLVDASTEEHLWANSYDRNLTDVFAVQTDISERVAGALEVNLLSRELETLQRSETENLRAYTSYLKGRELMRGRSEEGLKSAALLFEQAIAEDPTFARAYSGLADCWMVMGNFNVIQNEEAGRKARPMVRKAIELDDDLAEAHASLGLLFLTFDLDWAGSEREFKRAIEINPGYAQAHHWNSNLLANLGRVDEMLSEAKLAIELDPLSAAAASAGATQFFAAGKYDEALKFVEKALQLSSSHSGAKFMQPLILQALGRTDEALALATKWRQDEPRRNDATALLAWIFAQVGRIDESRRLVEELEGRRPRTSDIEGYLWFLYIPLGDLDRTFEYLNRAIETRDQDFMVIRLAPGMDAARADPRYHELLRRYNLEP